MWHNPADELEHRKITVLAMYVCASGDENACSSLGIFCSRTIVFIICRIHILRERSRQRNQPLRDIVGKAKRMELSLYRNAKSFDEYLDDKTLIRRMKLVALKRVSTSKTMPPAKRLDSITSNATIWTCRPQSCCLVQRCGRICDALVASTQKWQAFYCTYTLIYFSATVSTKSIEYCCLSSLPHQLFDLRMTTTCFAQTPNSWWWTARNIWWCRRSLASMSYWCHNPTNKPPKYCIAFAWANNSRKKSH